MTTSKTNKNSWDKQLQDAEAHLSRVDPIMAGLIAHYGRSTIMPHANYYEALGGSIISQQLSVKAAAAIEKKFCLLFGGESFPLPEHIVEKEIEELRTAGLSRAKATYIQDLAHHIINKTVRFDHLDNLTNEEIIKELTAVKGIGEWTVHMFLMFCMGRLDVLPVGDLGIKNGIMKLYGRESQPTPQEVLLTAQANNWYPYESVASWYIWKSLDNTPKVTV